MAMNESDREVLRQIAESQVEMGRALYELHGVVGRVDERLGSLSGLVDQRMDALELHVRERFATHQAEDDKVAKKVTDIEKRVNYVLAWAAGAFAIVAAAFAMNPKVFSLLVGGK